MRLFKCQSCAQRVYFDNTLCERCGHRLGYLPDVGLVSALEPPGEAALRVVLEAAGLPRAVLEDRGLLPADDIALLFAEAGEIWQPLVRPDRRYRFCENAALGLCNWLVPVEQGTAGAARRCPACRHNNRMPEARDSVTLSRWRRLELAKHHLFYSLVRLRLPLVNRDEDPQGGLAFDFLPDPSGPGRPRVMTGHLEGLVTIALREADDAERERMRAAMGEPYRTLLGHFRHEVGHYFWDRLVRDAGRLEDCRAVFGDERASYAEALRHYYAKGPLPFWQDRFVSAYATMHPWEDFAETWAHYLHIVDTLDTANAYGLEVHPRNDSRPEWHATIAFDPYREADFDRVIDNWLPLSSAVNSLNRSMGQPDLYPFILSPTVIGKLRFIHHLVQDHPRTRGVGGPAADGMPDGDAAAAAADGKAADGKAGIVPGGEGDAAAGEAAGRAAAPGDGADGQAGAAGGDGPSSGGAA
ncbi:putative zinc-binding peptidase [Roseomonas sp. NAR14]|uniref:Zinc-binding peptidase n=1 Tax=Roseomonas acroporae TaxID=2937791 RepID=A0A9X1YA34_9PROT|nr:putative zinc-binding metallopeptidase [Roseomonas acroporae]MCK8784907.1 putative zinc-binding peptidase [Roseomonas acroporae]